MEKIVEDIWKTTWLSLASVVVIIGITRYLANDRWWEIDGQPAQTLEEYESSLRPLVHYAIKNPDKNSFINTELIIKNIPQDEQSGENGTFENVLAGQVMYLKLNSGGQTVRSPVFRLQDREIRLLIFERIDKKMVYRESRSRIRKPPVPTFSVLDERKEKHLFQMDIIRGIENYKPFEEVSAKEPEKKPDNQAQKDNLAQQNEPVQLYELTQKKELKNLENLFIFNKLKFNLPQYSQSSLEHKSICE